VIFFVKSGTSANKIGIFFFFLAKFMFFCGGNELRPAFLAIYVNANTSIQTKIMLVVHQKTNKAVYH
jgi:hypothetical protein